MSYIDGFVIPMPKKNLAAYRKMAQLGAKIWKEHGALQYWECVADDLACAQDMQGKPLPSFAGATKLKKNETIVFSCIMYKSRKHRDQVNAKVMSDPRMKMPPNGMPFDLKRMCMAGFKPIVFFK